MTNFSIRSTLQSAVFGLMLSLFTMTVSALETSSAIKGMVHVTGGGFQDNLPRILPAHLKAVVDLSSWSLPPVFRWLAQTGGLDALSILHTFNAGVGFVLCVSAEEADGVAERLSAILEGESVIRLGHLDEKPHQETAISFLHLDSFTF